MKKKSIIEIKAHTVVAAILPISISQFENTTLNNYLLKELKDLLDPKAITVTGKPLVDYLDSAAIFDEQVISKRNNPIKLSAGIAVLKGNLAPLGAVIKPAAASKELLKHKGKALVFDSIEDFHSRADDPKLEIDENFEETIKSRYRDDFSYYNFSEGEKFRIDVALLLTWRQIARLKNSVNTNLLILDEVFDSSLDTGGMDEFMKLLYDLGQDTNVFVISHKGDQLFDKFRSVIRFEKRGNFSQIAK